MFTEVFVKYIQTKNITAYQVAKGTDISQGTMNEYKNGKKLPTMLNLIKISDYLDCSIDYLLGRTDNPNAHKEQINGTISQSNVNSDNSTVNVNSALSEKDSLMSEFMNEFIELRFEDKVKAMEFVSKLKNK